MHGVVNEALKSKKERKARKKMIIWLMMNRVNDNLTIAKLFSKKQDPLEDQIPT